MYDVSEKSSCNLRNPIVAFVNDVAYIILILCFKLSYIVNYGHLVV